MIEIDQSPDAYFEHALAAKLRRRATAAGLTIRDWTGQADLDRRTFERWHAGQKTIGLRHYLSLLRVIRNAEKMQHRAVRSDRPRRPPFRKLATYPDLPPADRKSAEKPSRCQKMEAQRCFQ
jgi:hypothetical protein